jgi:hypothetical protein
MLGWNESRDETSLFQTTAQTLLPEFCLAIRYTDPLGAVIRHPLAGITFAKLYEVVFEGAVAAFDKCRHAALQD